MLIIVRLKKLGARRRPGRNDGEYPLVTSAVRSRRSAGTSMLVSTRCRRFVTLTPTSKYVVPALTKAVAETCGLVYLRVRRAARGSQRYEKRAARLFRENKQPP